MDFEKEFAELKALADRNCAVNEVLKTLHRYVNYYSQEHIEGVMAQFADEPDVSLEVADEGKVVGLENIRRYFSYMPIIAKKPGILMYHYVTTEVVAVAEDGKTAKVTAMSPSCDAMAKAQMQNWCYGKYYVDFIRNAQGEWKIWHIQWFSTFEAPVTVGWLKQQTAHKAEFTDPNLADAYEETLRVEREKSSYPEDWAYPTHFDPKKQNYLMPEPAEPYAAWDGMTSMRKTREY